MIGVTFFTVLFINCHCSCHFFVYGTATCTEIMIVVLWCLHCTTNIIKMLRVCDNFANDLGTSAYIEDILGTVCNE